MGNMKEMIGIWQDESAMDDRGCYYLTFDGERFAPAIECPFPTLAMANEALAQVYAALRETGEDSELEIENGSPFVRGLIHGVCVAVFNIAATWS